jgi:hypothetical protein
VEFSSAGGSLGLPMVLSSNTHKNMKQPEYTEGPKAMENFERMATAIFKAPKAGGRRMRKKSSKTASERKPKNSDKD